MSRPRHHRSRPRPLAGLLLLLLTTTTGGCGTHAWTEPSFANGGLLANAAPFEVPHGAEGGYTLEDSGDTFGPRVALVVRDGGVSFFDGQNDIYARLYAGCLPSAPRLVLEGFWRATRTNRGGLIRLQMASQDAADAICNGLPLPKDTALRLVGHYGEQSVAPQQPLTLTWAQPLKSLPFTVVAHRGGCRTSDQCGASENSLAIMKKAHSLGADAIEIDVQMTADGVPVVYHDAEFSDRLVQGPFCVGPVEDFTLAHIRALCRLTYGEPVPTLDEALATIVQETRLAGVWLDIKSPAAIPPALALTADWRQRAKAQGRSLSMVFGLYSDDMVQAWIAASPPAEERCLVELDPRDIQQAGCDIWAPRWTRGPMSDRVQKVQEAGFRVVFWTVDERAFVDLLLTEARPNALLTNRPGLVLQRFQEVGAAPWTP